MAWGIFRLYEDGADDDTREYINNNCKEGVDPRSAWDDWGDSERDHQVESRSDVHASTVEEIEQYYDENRPSGWWPFS